MSRNIDTEVKQVSVKSESFNELTSIVGDEKARIICENLGGDQIYIPNLKSFDRENRNMSILSEFNGKNYAQLAKKYHLGEMMVRNIIKNGKDTKEC